MKKPHKAFEYDNKNSNINEIVGENDVAKMADEMNLFFISLFSNMAVKSLDSESTCSA